MTPSLFTAYPRFVRAVAYVLVIGVGTATSTQPSSQPASTPPAGEPPMVEPAAKLTADQLYDDHKAKRAELTKLYAGKTIEVSGKVRDISHFKTHMGITFTFEVKGTSIQGLPCTLTAKYHDRAEGLVGKDQVIKVRGTYVGNLEVIAQISDAEIIEKGPGTPEIITAAELAKGFPKLINDQVKDGRKTFVIKGKVQPLTAVPNRDLTLSEDGKILFAFNTTGFSRQGLAKFKPGDEIILAGNYEWVDNKKPIVYFNGGALLSAAP